MRKIDDPWEVSIEKETNLVKWLRKFLTDTTTENEEGTVVPMIVAIRDMIEKNPTEWWTGHHFGWGMWCRNQLRTNGFSEKDLGIANLDDHYISFVEQAVKLEK